MANPIDRETGLSASQAQVMLEDLANVFLNTVPDRSEKAERIGTSAAAEIPNMDARYRTLVEQIPAVVFMVYLDRGVGEAYVSPYIERTLGYSRAEWLEDPVRWYRQIHPDDSMRWSVEAAEMFLTGRPLRSVYRVIARDGHVVWFHCEAKVVRTDDGHPWFIQGVAFDITELKQAESELESERNFVSAILNTVRALIMVLDPNGRIVHFNRSCEQATGRTLADVRGLYPCALFSDPEARESFRRLFGQLRRGQQPAPFESHLETGESKARLISWSGTPLPGSGGEPRHYIATGIDITESKRLEKAVLEIIAREQRRIGQDLHDGLGQHLTGIAFMGKVLQQKLAEKSPAEAAAAGRIVDLVNQAVNKTRELSRGLLPVVADEGGLMSALEHLSAEVADLFSIDCRFQCDDPVFIHDEDVATHLYHVAREAVTNAIRHGRATLITIRLQRDTDSVTLDIADNGSGLPADLANSPGMGLHIMNYRAKMIGGTLEAVRRPEGGSLVSCTCRPTHRATQAVLP